MLPDGSLLSTSLHSFYKLIPRHRDGQRLWRAYPLHAGHKLDSRRRSSLFERLLALNGFRVQRVFKHQLGYGLFLEEADFVFMGSVRKIDAVLNPPAVVLYVVEMSHQA